MIGTIYSVHDDAPLPTCIRTLEDIVVLIIVVHRAVHALGGCALRMV